MTRKKILLVDDSATTLMVERMVLRGEPYELMAARNGREAVAIALRECPDLILLDVAMPGMDGFEVCREIRARCSRPIPIIFVTTPEEGHTTGTAFDCDCGDSIMKPISSTELLSRIREVLG
jgi:CheY-like chemotaxis protein